MPRTYGHHARWVTMNDDEKKRHAALARAVAAWSARHPIDMARADGAVMAFARAEAAKRAFMREREARIRRAAMGHLVAVIEQQERRRASAVRRILRECVARFARLARHLATN